MPTGGIDLYIGNVANITLPPLIANFASLKTKKNSITSSMTMTACVLQKWECKKWLFKKNNYLPVYTNKNSSRCCLFHFTKKIHITVNYIIGTNCKQYQQYFCHLTLKKHNIKHGLVSLLQQKKIYHEVHIFNLDKQSI